MEKEGATTPTGVEHSDSPGRRASLAMEDTKLIKRTSLEKGADGKDRPERKLTLIKLIGITCAAVAGGPYGFEDCVGAGGPSATIIGLLIVPLFWSIPMALMTAELATMIPENGGHILWVDKAFGSFWSFQNSYWSLLCYVFEGGLMPVMFMDYLSHLVGRDFTPQLRLCIGLSVMTVITVVNILGADSVGSAAVILGLCGTFPFICMIALGLPFVTAERVLATPRETAIKWPLFLTILLWNTAGYDSVGACAGEVKNPSVNFPKAVFYSVAFTIILDIFVLSVAVSVHGDYTHWQDGTFVKVAHILGGNTLAFLFALGASISVVGLLCALLCTSSRILYGMAMVGTLPKWFAAMHPRYHTPYLAMIFMAMLMAVTTFLPFEVLAEAEMWFYCITTILKFASLVKLRKTHADMPRPYRIPLGYRGLQAFIVTPILFCLFVIIFSDTVTHLVGSVGVIFSAVAYIVGTRYGSAKSDKLINFEVLGDV